MRMRGEVDAVRDNPGLYYHAAAAAMRRILIEHARSRGRKKRGGDMRKLSLDIVHVAETVDLDQVIAMDAAIDGLREVSDRAAELVQLRFFAGLTEAEAAKAMGISERTARREWSFARAWLFKALNDSA
jgi:RNA polymerase sigma factor (TIGR02999 family)